RSLAKVGHIDDVRVRDRGERLRFHPESVNEPEVAGELLPEELDDDGLLQRPVLRVQNLAHGANAESPKRTIWRALGRVARPVGQGWRTERLALGHMDLLLWILGSSRRNGSKKYAGTMAPRNTQANSIVYILDISPISHLWLQGVRVALAKKVAIDDPF